jgi:hypothetical protein
MNKMNVEKNGYSNNFKRNLNQLWILLWKNQKVQIRSLIGLFLEVFSPCLFAIILLPIRTIVKSQVYSEPIVYKPFSLEQNTFSFQNFTLIYAYQPKNNITEEIMKRVGLKLRLIPIG